MKIPLVIALVCLVLANGSQNVPIQKVYDGVTIGQVTANFHLEAVFDLMCPDSAQSNTVLNQVFQKINFNQQTAMYMTYHIF